MDVFRSRLPGMTCRREASAGEDVLMAYAQRIPDRNKTLTVSTVVSLLALRLRLPDEAHVVSVYKSSIRGLIPRD